MPERLPPHSHCVQCDNPIDEGQRFCSKECLQAYNKSIDKSNRRNWIFFGVVIVALVILAILTYG